MRTRDCHLKGWGIKTYYTQIYRRLKTLDELKNIVMEELCENPVVHNIQITYRMPNEILKYQINYKYMVIETDKHVKIMFDKLERIAKVTNIELYIQLEPPAVWQKDIQQTTTTLIMLKYSTGHTSVSESPLCHEAVALQWRQQGD